MQFSGTAPLRFSGIRQRSWGYGRSWRSWTPSRDMSGTATVLPGQAPARILREPVPPGQVPALQREEAPEKRSMRARPGERVRWKTILSWATMPQRYQLSALPPMRSGCGRPTESAGISWIQLFPMQASILRPSPCRQRISGQRRIPPLCRSPMDCLP